MQNYLVAMATFACLYGLMSLGLKPFDEFGRRYRWALEDEVSKTVGPVRHDEGINAA